MFLAAAQPLLDTNTTRLLVALISAATGIITLAIIPLVIILFRVRRDQKSTKRDISAVKDQVVNDHVDDEGDPINMRVEADERHGDSSQKLTAIMGALTNLRRSTDRNFELIRVDIQRLNAHDDRDDQRLKDLEATQPSHKEKR